MQGLFRQQVSQPLKPSSRPPAYSLWSRSRRCAPTVASGAGPSGPTPAEEAFAVAEECMRLFETSDTGSILQYLPDSVIDNALERKRSKLSDAWGSLSDFVPSEFSSSDGDMRLEELLELIPATAFVVDSFAMRAVVFSSKN